LEHGRRAVLRPTVWLRRRHRLVDDIVVVRLGESRELDPRSRELGPSAIEVVGLVALRPLADREILGVGGVVVGVPSL
jgi:hypothetical protein